MERKYNWSSSGSILYIFMELNSNVWLSVKVLASKVFRGRLSKIWADKLVLVEA